MSVAAHNELNGTAHPQLFPDIMKYTNCHKSKREGCHHIVSCVLNICILQGRNDSTCHANLQGLYCPDCCIRSRHRKERFCSSYGHRMNRDNCVTWCWKAKSTLQSSKLILLEKFHPECKGYCMPELLLVLPMLMGTPNLYQEVTTGSHNQWALQDD